MGIRSLVSLGFLLVPVAITLGVLLGLDAYRTATGQSALFVDNRVVTEIYCDLSFGIPAKSHGENFILNPNQWNVKEPNPGASCLHVVIHKNGTYATANTAPEWWVTWQYPRGPENDPVHGYPNIMLDPTELPVEISALKNINIDLEWGYAVGSEPQSGFDEATLSTTSGANVALDIFIDSDKTVATDASKAKFEVMLWLGHFNPATQPIGYGTVLATKEVNGTTFQLYSGQNNNKQYVLSWYAAASSTTFDGDILEFVTALQSVPGLTNVPAASDYIGYISLGSETLFATTNVTFSVPKFELEMVK